MRPPPPTRPDTGAPETPGGWRFYLAQALILVGFLVFLTLAIAGVIS